MSCVTNFLSILNCPYKIEFTIRMVNSILYGQFKIDKKSSSSNLIFQTRFFKNQLQINRGSLCLINASICLAPFCKSALSADSKAKCPLWANCPQIQMKKSKQTIFTEYWIRTHVFFKNCRRWHSWDPYPPRVGKCRP